MSSFRAKRELHRINESFRQLKIAVETELCDAKAAKSHSSQDFDPVELIEPISTSYLTVPAQMDVLYETIRSLQRVRIPMIR